MTAGGAEMTEIGRVPASFCLCLLRMKEEDRIHREGRR